MALTPLLALFGNDAFYVICILLGVVVICVSARCEHALERAMGRPLSPPKIDITYLPSSGGTAGYLRPRGNCQLATARYPLCITVIPIETAATAISQWIQSRKVTP